VASAEDVAVQVRHGFAAVRAVVDDEPVAAFFNPSFRHFGGFEQQMAEQFVVVRRGLGDARNGFFGKIKTCVGAWGLMSRMASTRSSS
jgi:hypothetical protein